MRLAGFSPAVVVDEKQDNPSDESFTHASLISTASSSSSATPSKVPKTSRHQTPSSRQKKPRRNVQVYFTGDEAAAIYKMVNLLLCLCLRYLVCLCDGVFLLGSSGLSWFVLILLLVSAVPGSSGFCCGCDLSLSVCACVCV